MRVHDRAGRCERRFAPAAATASRRSARLRSSMTPMSAWLAPETRSRRILAGVMVYIACTVVFALVAGAPRLREHTQYNHYALLAEAWIHGRQDLAYGPPHYAQNNDFAVFRDKTYISFPPFPAVLMAPSVAMSGSAENFRDGQFVVWIA